MTSRKETMVSAVVVMAVEVQVPVMVEVSPEREYTAEGMESVVERYISKSDVEASLRDFIQGEKKRFGDDLLEINIESYSEL